MLSWNMGQGMPSLLSPSASLQFTQKGDYTLIWSLNICDRHLGDSSRLPGLVPSMAYVCSPTGLYVFAYFKSCSLSVWLPMNLNLGAD